MRRIALLALLVVALVAAACHGGPHVTVPSGSDQYKVASPSADTQWAASASINTAFPFGGGDNPLYPYSIGSSTPTADQVWIGGKAVGQQSRTLTWDEMKNSYDGAGLRIESSDFVVSALRVDNLEDGIDPRGSDAMSLRNLYMKYIRDDCVENDESIEGEITDSLFDGCNTFYSEQDNSVAADSGDQIVIDHVLARLKALPGPRGTNDNTITGHGNLFKIQGSNAKNQIVLTDDIFLVEKTPNGGCASIPSGTTASNVTIVWVGGGSYPCGTITGMTVTTDISVWDDAKAEWQSRHGCTSFDSCDTGKLYNPDPY